MFKFEIGNLVRVIKGSRRFYMIGKVEVIYPAGMLDKEVIYKLSFGQSLGQYKESELEKY